MEEHDKISTYVFGMIMEVDGATNRQVGQKRVRSLEDAFYASAEPRVYFQLMDRVFLQMGDMIDSPPPLDQEHIFNCWTACSCKSVPWC